MGKKQQEVVYKVTFKQKLLERFYDWLIDKIKKLILIVISLVIIYVFVSYNMDVMLANILLNNVMGVSNADAIYRYSSPYLRFFTYSAINKALGKMIPIKLPWGEEK